LLCHILAILKSGSTIHGLLAAALPLARTFGKAGAPACVAWSEKLARAGVPSLTIACS
jgi:hypothetical protein